MNQHTTLIIYPGGHQILIALRILMGLAGGTTLPSLTVLLAAWIPENERGKLGAFVLGGSQVRISQWKPDFVKWIDYFRPPSDWKCFVLLHLWINSISLAVANCVLFLECSRNRLVYSICECFALLDEIQHWRFNESIILIFSVLTNKLT